ncbi:MAG: SRPBCC family protein [Bacteroidota bacterium]
MRIQLWMATLAIIFWTGSGELHAQSMSKPYKTLKVSRLIKAPAERVWQAMVKDYGEISNFSPYIFASNYEAGSLEGVEGAQRRCYFNEKSTRWSHETIKYIDEENMKMKNILLGAEKFPLDIDNSYAIYSVKDNGDGTSTAGYEFNFRTKPAFMGGLFKNQFKKTLEGTLVGLDHYVTTGEIVNATSGNWKEIKKQYN